TTGLWEFWHVESGERPTYDEGDGEWRPAEASGLVFVLIPGGEFAMGAAAGDLTVPAAAAEYETPARSVRLSPFLMSKFEVTQGQWIRATGRNPSQYPPLRPGEARNVAPEEIVGWTNPVENVTWTDVARVVRRWGVDLPTEARWEAACRAAGGDAPWHSGHRLEDLAAVANFGGAEWENPGSTGRRGDGRLLHAPVGTLQPNAFGLYDMHGNVAEWCADDAVFKAADARLRAGDGRNLGPFKAGRRVARGGGCRSNASACRATARAFGHEGLATFDIGFRPAADLH
ncbi:MAG TPA: formylglycine-generating enzyme family protein, partial [Planctomycetota bacterium]|nr:formylglycine-generating enzyme family protein [Planctomycetota bacterium]